MCPRTIYGVKLQNMDLKTWKNILKFTKNSKIILSGMGEPLIHPNIDHFLDLATEKNIKVSTFTNGILAQNKKNTLKKFNNICFSIKTENQANINFEKVLKVIKQLKKEKLWVNIVEMKSDKKNISNLIKELKPYVRGIGLSNLASWSVRMENENISNSKPRYCIQPWFNCVIEPSGDVYPCDIFGDQSTLKENPILYFKEKKVEFDTKSLCMGNINEEKFEDIWNSKKYQNFRKNAKEVMKSNKHHQPCYHCPYRSGSGY